MMKHIGLVSLAMVMLLLASCKRHDDDTPVDPNPNPRTSIGLVAHYKMDGDGADVSGNGFHAVSIGGITAVADRNGVAGKALKFDGSTGRLVVNNTVNTAFEMDSAMTISFWINGYASNGPECCTHVISKFGPFQDGWAVRWYHDNDAQLQFMLIYGTQPGSSTTPLDRIRTPNTMFMNEWHHVTYTYSLATKTARMYVDGELTQSLPNCHYRFTHTDDEVFIGGAAMPLDYGQFLDGSAPIILDEVKVYDIELSAAEIRALYAE